jgi:hypothetical protein
MSCVEYALEENSVPPWTRGDFREFGFESISLLGALKWIQSRWSARSVRSVILVERPSFDRLRFGFYLAISFLTELEGSTERLKGLSQLTELVAFQGAAPGKFQNPVHGLR